MKKSLAVLAGLFFSVAIHAQVAELPDTQVKDLQSGKKVAFNETVAKGKITLISFWATWCSPCKKEIRNIKEKMGDWRKEADFDYITVSIDETRHEGLAKTYVTTQTWDFPNYIDTNSDLKRSLNFQTVPFIMIIDKNGKVAYMHSGYEEGGEEEVFARIKELAKQ